jgi:hypothetical protein
MITNHSIGGKFENLLQLKGKVELAFSLEEFLEERRKDIPPKGFAKGIKRTRKAK